MPRAEFNSYGARRGNHEVMMRGTFANIRIRNRMLDNVEGGLTRYAPTGETLPIYDAAMRYMADGTPLVVIAGKEYGTGSSRDWAAKGTLLLGVRAVIAESFERIHRSNLVGMGVLPLQFHDGETADSLGLDGSETFSITGVGAIEPRQDVEVTVTARPTERAAPSPRGAASTPTTSSNISTPAGSCTTCCGGWRPDGGAGRAPAIAGGRRSACRASPITSTSAIAACAPRPASRASISRPTSWRSRASSTAMSASDLKQAYLQTLRCKTCGTPTHWEPLTPPPHERMGVNARLVDPALLEGVEVREVDGRSWDE